MSSSPVKRRTGFLALPLELRQMVYDELLSQDVLLFDIGTISHCDRSNSFPAHPQLEAEMSRREKKYHGKASFRILPSVWSPPEQFHLRNLERITIVLCHYNRDDTCGGDYRDTRRDQIEIMRSNMQNLVERLKSCYKVLPPTTIAFYNTPPAGSLIDGDPYWCRALNKYQRSSGDLLDTVDSTCNTPSVFEYLLSPLIDLELCTSMYIRLLTGIFKRCSMARFPKAGSVAHVTCSCSSGHLIQAIVRDRHGLEPFTTMTT